MKITLAHSPDADDAFMFYALAKGLIDSGKYEFEHVLCDINTLTQKAIHEQVYDVTAISYYGYTFCDQQYELMETGSSMGDDYGPLVIASRQLLAERYQGDQDALIQDIRSGSLTVGVPGRLTSTFVIFQLWAGQNIQSKEIYFQDIEPAISDGRCDIGLIIHEGQITLDQEKYVIIEDLGHWWYQSQGQLLLPLGCNVIRKSLLAEDKREINRILKESIEYSLNHLEPAIEYAMEYGRGISDSDAERFVQMYVNQHTLSLAQENNRGYRSVERFYDLSHEAGLIDHMPSCRILVD